MIKDLNFYIFNPTPLTTFCAFQTKNFPFCRAALESTGLAFSKFMFTCNKNTSLGRVPSQVTAPPSMGHFKKSALAESKKPNCKYTGTKKDIVRQTALQSKRKNGPINNLAAGCQG